VTSAAATATKQIDAGLLKVGYAEAGPADGPAVLLLHGWPYDIHSYADVAPLLAAEGYRTIIPYLRGYGTTRFLSEDTSATASRRSSPSTPSRCWTPWRSARPSSPASTGEHARPTLSRRSGPSAAGRWYR
jgi:pimeloyl-ACP methyl ester carboxylesterase